MKIRAPQAASDRRPTPTDDAAWHALTVAGALARTASRVDGLTTDEALRRAEQYGPNRLVAAPPTPALRILAAQLTGVVVWLLAAAFAISAILADWVECAAIGVVLVINTAIGFVTELRARRTMEALLRYEAPRASVVRGGIVAIVDAQELVPGDIVALRTGDAIPADARLIASTDLRTNEAALTGESMPVSKDARAELTLDTPLADRVTCVYKGTTVAAGIGRAVVFGTGIATEFGRIGGLLASVEDAPTPLERRLNVLGRRLAWIAIGVAAAIGALEALRGSPLPLVLETAIALAVAAVPEALPAVSTIVLAVGLHRMAKRHALVRRLPSVESLGSTTVICTDKTRTLTSGEMTVVRVWTPAADFDRRAQNGSVAQGDSRAPQAARRAVQTAYLASWPPPSNADGTPAAADPVDRAIFEAAAELDAAPTSRPVQIAPEVVPFSSERKYMACFRKSGGRTLAFVKGAPFRILAMTDADEAARQRFLAVNEALAADGLRVLAVATGAVDEPSASALTGLQFAGFIGLMDPPARGVHATIARLREAGLRTIMITGDQKRTAQAVGRELGLLGPGDVVMDERELRSLPAAELKNRVRSVAAFSRVAPEDKLAIVRALQENGQVVAMFGDGVNDAPALKQADVGVAMGLRGTDVAKEAAAIVLQDDRFETIAAAVEEGRVIYDNLRKFVFYLFSCNLAEIAVLLGAAVAGLPTPLLPIQILWMNIVTDTFPALALAMEPGDPDVMRRPPKHPEDTVLSGRFLREIAAYGGLIAAASLAAFEWALVYDPAHAGTVAFMTLSLAQILHLGNARSAEPVLSLSRARANRYAVAAVILSGALQTVGTENRWVALPLGVDRLDAGAWVAVALFSAVPAVIGQTAKLVRARKSRRRT